MHFSVWDPQLSFEAINLRNTFSMVVVSQIWLIIDSSEEVFKITDYLTKTTHSDCLR